MDDTAILKLAARKAELLGHTEYATHLAKVSYLSLKEAWLNFCEDGMLKVFLYLGLDPYKLQVEWLESLGIEVYLADDLDTWLNNFYVVDGHKNIVIEHSYDDYIAGNKRFHCSLAFCDYTYDIVLAALLPFLGVNDYAG